MGAKTPARHIVLGALALASRVCVLSNGQSWHIENLTAGLMCFNPLPPQFRHELDILRTNPNGSIAEKARYVLFYQKPETD